MPIEPARLELMSALARKVLWLSSWTIHHANHIRPNVDGLKVSGCFEVAHTCRLRRRSRVAASSVMPRAGRLSRFEAALVDGLSRRSPATSTSWEGETRMGAQKPIGWRLTCAIACLAHAEF